MKNLVADIMEKLKPDRFAIIGDDLYLTDYKVVFRISGAAGLKPEGVTAEINPETMVQVFINAKETDQSMAIKSIDLVNAAPLPCKACQGTGKLFFCTSCDGEGEVYCEECDNWNDCKHCRGTGNDIKGNGTGDNFDACSGCGGMGIVQEPIALFSHKFDARLLRIIAEVAPEAVLFAPLSEHPPAYFKADGTEGLIQRMMDV